MSLIGTFGTPDAQRISMGLRETLSANKNYYVATTGSDSNDGLTLQTPLLTTQKAIDTASKLDTNGYDIFINYGAGTFNAMATYHAPIGCGRVFLVGASTDNTQTVLNANTNDLHNACIYSKGKSGTPIYLANLTLQASGTNGYGIYVRDGAEVFIDNVACGSCSSAHFYAIGGSRITPTNVYNNSTLKYSITGNAPVHSWLYDNSVFNSGGCEIYVSDGLTFSSRFAWHEKGSINDYEGAHFRGTKVSGACTNGVKYRIGQNTGGADFTNAGAPNNTVGTIFTGNGNTPTSYGTGNLFVNPTGSSFFATQNAVGITWTSDGNSAVGCGGFPGDGTYVIKSGAQYVQNDYRLSGYGRVKMWKNITYYVRDDGDDGNTGLVNDSSGAFVTMNTLLNWIADNLDLGGYTITVQVGHGSYPAPTPPAFTGRGTVQILGTT